MRRGDEAFAQGNYEEALAEYRLAVRQGADGPEITARVAHPGVDERSVSDPAWVYPLTDSSDTADGIGPLDAGEGKALGP